MNQNGDAHVEVLTNLEAAKRLRLTDDYPNEGDAVNALHRLVRRHGLRPLECGKTYKFTDAELDRWAHARTDEFTPRAGCGE